tara:strand:- start:5864 stop:8269 length:2406 start_codon:yes stop_codon:yes gene_type:complete
LHKYVYIFIITVFNLVFSQTYSWEDGGTILGSYGNLTNAINVGATDGVTPYDGDYMLSVSESPISGTPEAYLSYIQNLSAGDIVTASFFGYDDVPDGSPSLRIWGRYVTSTDITSSQGSAGGNSDYTDGTGWSQLSHTWTIPDGKDALVVQARLYTSSTGDDPTAYYIDLVEVSAPETATVNFAGFLDNQTPGCTDELACNYNSEATANDGSCLFDDCLGECGGAAVVDACGVCNGDSSGCSSNPLFFSEYAEGSSNNKFLEIYNPTSETVYLSGYAFPSNSNGPDVLGEFDYWNTFDSNAQILPGDVFVICHTSASSSIQAVCDQTHSYLSNGNDAYCLAFGTSTDYQVLDCVGDVSEDPGSSGWGVAGVLGGTKDHTLVRKSSVTSGNSGDWVTSAGTNAESSEWIVFDVDTWLYVGFHPHDLNVYGCTDPAASNYNPDANSDDGTCDFSIPVANAGPDQTVEYLDLVTLSGTGSDDGSIVGYLWTQTAGPSVSLSSYEEQVVTFTAPNEYGVLEFSLQVIDNDFNYSSLDNVSITVGGLSIYDVQYTEDQGAYCFETALDGTEAAISGIITHVSPSGSFFMQDSNILTWSGILAYDASLTPIVGDEVSIFGEIDEYYSQTEIKNITSYNVISSGNVVLPLQISASDLGIQCSASGEQYESMLVGLSGVTLNSVDEFGNWTASDLNGGSFMIDDYYYNGNDWPSLSQGDSYDCLSGVVAYSYGEFKVYPRGVFDFECYQVCVSNGDVNEDGSIDVSDIVLVVNHILNISLLTSSCLGDLNQDSLVDVLDIVKIINLILG